MSLPLSGFGLIIASNAKTFEQQPPKIKLSITDTAKKDGIVSRKKDIVNPCVFVLLRFKATWSCGFFACVNSEVGRRDAVVIELVSSVLIGWIFAVRVCVLRSLGVFVELMLSAPVLLTFGLVDVLIAQLLVGLVV